MCPRRQQIAQRVRALTLNVCGQRFESNNRWSSILKSNNQIKEINAAVEESQSSHLAQHLGKISLDNAQNGSVLTTRRVDSLNSKCQSARHGS